MTRTASLASMRDKRIQHEKPAEGSKLRALYDLFIMYKGLPIPNDTRWLLYPNGDNFSTAIDQLQDFYGMDIRSFPTKYRPRLPNEKGTKSYCPVGEYKNGEYHDYVAERLKNQLTAS